MTHICYLSCEREVETTRTHTHTFYFVEGNQAGEADQPEVFVSGVSGNEAEGGEPAEVSRPTGCVFSSSKPRTRHGTAEKRQLLLCEFVPTTHWL